LQADKRHEVQDEGHGPGSTDSQEVGRRMRDKPQKSQQAVRVGAERAQPVYQESPGGKSELGPVFPQQINLPLI